MQFKHPELLWALLLLLIPIFIHLFQLRKFKKISFTNVKLLQKVVAQSRRSSTLKKWLLLCTRLLLIASLVLAFAQPFIANSSALQKKEIVIYLDDSFSMHAKKENSTLFQDAVQRLLAKIPENTSFSLFTNKKEYKNTSLRNLQNELLSLSPSAKQYALNEVYLKANTYFSDDVNALKHFIVISDFQQPEKNTFSDTSESILTHFVPTRNASLKNISIDSVFITDDRSSLQITALLSSNTALESTPVSLYNADTLIAKTAANFSNSLNATVLFTIPKDRVIKGKLEVVDEGLPYDNRLYFNLNAKEKIKALVIGNGDANFLKRIFNTDEFEFSASTLQNLNYSTIDDQNIVVLNELSALPNTLISNLNSFKGNGSIVVIPAIGADITSYNNLLKNYYSTAFVQAIQNPLNISKISYAHPLFRNVFEKKVSNFQQPQVANYFEVKSTALSPLSYQNGQPFLLGSDTFYVFTASLNSDNTNFKNSPLIVPTFYNMAAASLKLPELYHVLNNNVTIDIPIQLPKDNILTVSKTNTTFIPQQTSFANKVSLSFDEALEEDGIYSILKEDEFLKNISFNYSRIESELQYLDLSTISNETINESIEAVFDKLQKDNTIRSLWKWFVILALLFMLLEVLIQKYL